MSNPEGIARIEAIVAAAMRDLGYDLVRVRYSGARGATMQIMAERSDGAAMTVDDCAEISRTVSALMDVEDPIAEPYVLEVSSPGIDRPLVREDDFRRFAGQAARIEARIAIDGRKRFRGRLLGLHDGRVRLATDQGEVEIPVADVATAKLDLMHALEAGRTGAGPRGRS